MYYLTLIMTLGPRISLSYSMGERLSIMPKVARGRDGIHPRDSWLSAVKRDQLKREGRYRATPMSQPLTSGTKHFSCLSWHGHVCFPSSFQQRNCLHRSSLSLKQRTDAGPGEKGRTGGSFQDFLLHHSIIQQGLRATVYQAPLSCRRLYTSFI